MPSCLVFLIPKRDMMQFPSKYTVWSMRPEIPIPGEIRAACSMLQRNPYHSHSIFRNVSYVFLVAISCLLCPKSHLFWHISTDFDRFVYLSCTPNQVSHSYQIASDSHMHNHTNALFHVSFEEFWTARIAASMKFAIESTSSGASTNFIIMFAKDTTIYPGVILNGKNSVWIYDIFLEKSICFILHHQSSASPDVILVDLHISKTRIFLSIKHL